MTTRRFPRRTLLAALVFALLVPLEARAYSGGPPDGFCSDPPLFRSCTACHSSFPLNSGNGALTLIGLPSTYTPGETYHFNVHLVDPGQRRWGFELTAIQPISGDEGGTLIVENAVTTQVSYGTGLDRDYAKQTTAGTFANATFGDWGLYWVAPLAGAGTVRFYVAGNAANNNAMPSNDFIYAITADVTESISVAAQQLDHTPRLVLSAEPNPVRDLARLAFVTRADSPVELRVVDAEGRAVRTLVSAWLAGGEHRLEWDGRDALGRTVPSGVYFYLLNACGERTNLRTVKVR